MKESGEELSDQVVLDICERIELVAAEFYHYYADLFGDDADIVELWSKTAADEENHARQFELARKLRRGLVEGLKVDRVMADKALELISSVLKNVREHPPTLVDALHLAIRLEEHLSRFHMDCVAVYCDESSRKMFQAMMAADNGHIQRLKTVYDRLLSAGAQRLQR